MIRHLFVPGLLGLPPSAAGRDEWQSLPLLEAVLARADRSAEPVGYVAGLFALFGVETPPAADLPTAAIGFLAETGEAPPGCVLHADPVQLLPDRDSLLAFDLDEDPLDSDEIAGLLDAFNAHFGADGVRLAGMPGGRLYLHCDRTPSIRTHPLSTVLGRHIDPFLPDGEQCRRWRGLLNETQMLCHALAFNHEREARGRPVLGGLWFSGAGRLPSPGRSPVARVRGNDRLARGLLALSAGAGSDELLVEPAPGRAVMRADAGDWWRAVAALEDRMPGLLRGCAELHVHPGNGTVYRWHARSARRWWRRKRPLSAYLTAERSGESGGLRV